MLLQKTKNFFKSNLFKYISAEFLGVIISFLISTYILIYLGAKELGLFTFYMILVSLFSSIAQGAANSYLMKNFFKQDKSKTISSVNLTMAVFSFLAVFIYFATENYFASYYYTSYFIVFALLKAYNSTTFVVMRLNEDANSFFVWSILNKSLYTVPVVYLIIKESFTIDNFLFVLFINEILFFILLYGYIINKYKYSFEFELNYWKDNLKLSTNLFPHKIFKTIYENIDKYAIQFLLGLEALGIYSMILRLASPISILIQSINNELSVVMSKAITSNSSKNNVYSLEKKIFMLITTMIIFVFIIGNIYHFYIFNLGNNYFILLLTVVFLTTSKIFYYSFYNLNFFMHNNIVYFISFINIIIIIIGLLIFNNSILEVLKTIIISNIISLSLLNYYIYNHSLLKLTKYVYILYIACFVIFAWY